MNVGGIVLCGGKSRRMGRAKAWLPFGDELMLPRVVRLLREVVEPVVVVAAPRQDVPPITPEVQVVRDEREGRGPLQGLVAGLRALAGRVEAAYLSSCDVPLLSPTFVRRVIELLGEEMIAVPYVDGFHHPLAAVYHIAVLPLVEELLAGDRLRPVFLFEQARTRIIPQEDLESADPGLASLRNLNTPEDYAAALRSAGHLS